MQATKIVSIEITDTVTRVCEMAYGKRNPQVYKSVIFDNPEFTVDDGFVSDRPKYAMEFRAQLEKAGIKCKDAVFTLSSNKIVSREVMVPDMKEELIADLIEGERENYFPMDTTGYSLTFNVIEKIKAEKQLRIMVYAAQDLLIKNYLALASELDLKIVALDYSGNTIYQWLRKTTHEQMPMYLQINEKNAMFTILENGMFSLQRNMNFGSRVLTANLVDEGYYREELDEDSAMLKLVQNELIYKSYAEADSFTPTTEEENDLHQLRSRLTDATRPLIANVSRVLEYYNTKNREAQVNKIYIGGIGAKVKGLKELIESEFNGIEIVIVDQLPGVIIAKNNIICRERSSEFIACIGGAEQSINFYKKTEKEKLGKTIIFCLVALGVVIVASVLIVLNGKMEYDRNISRKVLLEAQIATVESGGIEVLESQYNESSAAIAEIEAMDKATFNYNENWNDIIDYLETQSPSSIVVTSLSSTETGLTLNIIVDSKKEAAKLLLQYQQIPHFKSVTINGLTETVDEETGISTVNFTLVCEYPVETESEDGIIGVEELLEGGAE